MASGEKPCSAPEAGQFDFWLGVWDLTWGEDGRGTNTITKIMDGCVILEEFDGRPTHDFRGMSVSMYVAGEGKWKQTWVDNAGGYLDFVGEFDGQAMILTRDTVLEGKPVKQRMVWYNIAADRLEWNWERSDDGGETWQTLWHIAYRRKA